MLGPTASQRCFEIVYGSIQLVMLICHLFLSLKILVVMLQNKQRTPRLLEQVLECIIK